jgi:hypothetical protein
MADENSDKSISNEPKSEYETLKDEIAKRTNGVKYTVLNPLNTIEKQIRNKKNTDYKNTLDNYYFYKDLIQNKEELMLDKEVNKKIIDDLKTVYKPLYPDSYYTEIYDNETYGKEFGGGKSKTRKNNNSKSKSKKSKKTKRTKRTKKQH